MTIEHQSISSLKKEESEEGGNRKTSEISLLQAIRNWVKLSFGAKNHSLEESVAELIEEHNAISESPISLEERALLENVLAFGEIKVSDVMIPRTDIFAVPNNITPDELKKIIVEYEHTRVPVYKGSLDEVTGFVHIKDLFRLVVKDEPIELEAIIRQVLYVPPTMKVIDLLAKMRSSRLHMALVLDEYGGTDGLVTFEDLMEEIVGEIMDEHDEQENSDIVKHNDYLYEVTGRSSVEEIEKLFNIKLQDDDDEEIDTIGGFVFSMMGKVPEKGEVCTHPSGVEFEIMDSDQRKVKNMIIRYVPNNDMKKISNG